MSLARRDLHRDPAGIRQGAPAPNLREVEARLELDSSKALDWKGIARRALRVGKGRSVTVEGHRLEVRAIDATRIVLRDVAGWPIVLPRPR